MKSSDWLAIVAAAIALACAWGTRRQAIGAMRQQWIDGLRNDLADLISLSRILAVTKPNSDKNRADKLRDLEMLETRIVLRLNLDESPHKELEAAMGEMLRKMSLEHDIDTLRTQIVGLARTVLKLEWEQAKNEGSLIAAIRAALRKLAAFLKPRSRP